MVQGVAMKISFCNVDTLERLLGYLVAGSAGIRARRGRASRTDKEVSIVSRLLRLLLPEHRRHP